MLHLIIYCNETHSLADWATFSLGAALILCNFVQGVDSYFFLYGYESGSDISINHVKKDKFLRRFRILFCCKIRGPF
jgi:hypothetical protein